MILSEQFKADWQKANRHTNGTNYKLDRQTFLYIETQKHRQNNRHTESTTDRQIDRQIDSQIKNRQVDRQPSKIKKFTQEAGLC